MQSTICKKDLIKRSFSKASATYDTFSHLQKEVNLHLLSLVPQGAFKRVLEIGCGTGNFTKQLVASRNIDRILGIDLSFDMLIKAEENLRQTTTEFYPICCDGEHICLKTETEFDLIVSASCMHWFQNLPGSLESICKNHLAQNGHIVCALFGKRTLVELEQVIKTLYGKKDFFLPASDFPTKTEIQGLLKDILKDFYVESVTIERKYPNLMELLLALKKTGTATPAGARPIFYSKGTIKEADKIYRDLFGSIRATYQVIFLRAQG